MKEFGTRSIRLLKDKKRQTSETQYKNHLPANTNSTRIITTDPDFLARPSVPFLKNLSPIERARMRRINRRERRARRARRITLYRDPAQAQADLL